MSFAEKISSLMQRPNQDLVSKDDVPWWLKYAGRGVGTVGSAIAMILGFWNCVGILLGSIDCLLSGVWQILAGFMVIVIEAPCCCMFVDFVQDVSNWVEKRPYWNRAVFYMGISLPPVLFCIGFGSLFGSGLIFATGVLYGLMALGRKASAEEMRANAAQLVDNAQPMATSAPARVPPV